MRKKSFPIHYDRLDTWECYQKQLPVELRQSIEEGKDLEPYRGLFEAVEQLPVGPEKEQISDALFSLVCGASTRPDFPYEEPSDLEAIRRCRRAAQTPLPGSLDMEHFREKVCGAWYGRVAGCLLGKPIEGMRTNMMHPFLRETNNFPMHRYILRADLTPERTQTYGLPVDRCWGDCVEAMPWDDDTNYTVLSQMLISRWGREFTSENVGELWLVSQPKEAYCTAERVAYLNLLRGYRPPETAQYKNPYREWIGAQIRGDYFGYINPGNPELAAEMAWRDASLSHVKNGIYGEMYVAAMLAAAGVTDEIRPVIEAGMAQIPCHSRLYRELSDLISGVDRGVDREDCFRQIHKAYNEHDPHDWCHTIPNALIVTAALLYGDGDFGRSVCMAVQAGFDTDCNGATVGSIVGMLKGYGAIEEAWVAPLNGKLETNIAGASVFSIESLVDVTLTHLPDGVA